MAARSTWKGFLKVSLVNIPVKVFPATESAAALSFNQLHAECQTRIQQKKWCPHCEREVTNAEIVKGYEFEKGRYVVVSEEDFGKVTVESTRVINLVQFADDGSLDPMYVDKSYYLAPDGAVAAEAFAVMREGMRGKAGIGKVALYGREYLVAVKPQEHGLVMYTLHHDAEIRGIDQVEDLDSVPEDRQAGRAQARQAGRGDVFRRAESEGLPRRVQGRVAPHHRCESGRRRGRRHRAGRNADQRRRSDGRAPKEPRCRQRRQETSSQGGTEEGQGGAGEEEKGRLEDERVVFVFVFVFEVTCQ